MVDFYDDRDDRDPVSPKQRAANLAASIARRDSFRAEFFSGCRTVREATAADFPVRGLIDTEVRRSGDDRAGLSHLEVYEPGWGGFKVVFESGAKPVFDAAGRYSTLTAVTGGKVWIVNK